ncbi:hypothetical protein HanIR_Chr11g0535871 [Helianthus annuus]|nr:hypothetical protein HanIR_Chr11g0535871 [Helianthus annuus]
MKFRLTAKNLKFFNCDNVAGNAPIIRPGTTVNSVRAVNFPIDGCIRPESPGAPARGSPRFNATTRSPSQYTPAKLHGSEVKSQDEKYLEPGISSSDFRIACNARKSIGFSIALQC